MSSELDCCVEEMRIRPIDDYARRYKELEEAVAAKLAKKPKKVKKAVKKSAPEGSDLVKTK